MCINHVSIIIKVAWNIRNYRYIWDVSGSDTEKGYRAGPKGETAGPCWAMDLEPP
jgi:hypothetical protein